MDSRVGKLAVFLLLIVGLLLWFALLAAGEGPEKPGPIRLFVVYSGAVLVALAPRVHRTIASGLERIRHPSPKQRGVASVATAVVATVVLYGIAVSQDRDFFPLWHDAASYLIQMQIFASGHLSLPPHPIADFFDTFHVLTQPRYVSIYFPGAALLFTPAVWLHLPVWLAPLLVAGASVGLLYRVVTEVVDGVGGVLAAVMLIALRPFRTLSLIVMSSSAMLFLSLIMVWAWLKWRQHHQMRWVVVLGLAAGLGAITRPFDAACFALPMAVAILWDLVRASSPGRQIVATVLVGVLCVAPFLVFQLAFNKSVTGSYWKSSYQLYMDRDAPQISPGFHTYDPSLRPRSVVPQKQIYHDLYNAPAVQMHRPELLVQTWLQQRLPIAAMSVLPANLLVIFLPLGVIAAKSKGRWVLATVIPVFVAAYTLYPFVLPHYWLVTVPSVFVLLTAGYRVIEHSLPQWRQIILSATFLATVAVSLAKTPPINTMLFDDLARRPNVLTIVNETLPTMVELPAVVLFRYSENDSMHLEPVYNFDVAWPDDAPIIKAHDLGARNQEILQYYADRQPNRVFYLYDRADGSLTRMGTPAEIRKSLAAHASTQPASSSATRPD